MNISIRLLILAPGITLLQNVIVKAERMNNDDSPHECDGCGKVLVTPYYVLFGIPPSSLIIETHKISGISDEKDIDFKRLVSEVQSISKSNDSCYHDDG